MTAVPSSDGKLWFSARTVFEHDKPGDGLFEERIVLLRAADFEEALARAEAAFLRGEGQAEIEELRNTLALADQIGGTVERPDLELLMRDSDLPADQYIDRFYTTGDERSDDDEGEEDLQS